MKLKRMTHPGASLLTAALICCSPAIGREKPATETTLIPPSAPLIACDPFFSVWSPSDKLTDAETEHWSGPKQPLSSVVRVDGKALRVMGASPSVLPAMEQKSLTVMPTQTIYTFEGAGVALTLTFTTPALPEDVLILSRPVTYLTYDFKATDGKEHEVSVYFGAGAELVVGKPYQEVAWSQENQPGLNVVKMGTLTQRVLKSKGDDHLIDWGYAYIAAPSEATAATGFERPDKLATTFAAKGALDQKSGTAKANEAGAGIELKPLKVGATTVSTWAMIAYDDLYSIQYNYKNLRPYWRKDGWEAKDLLAASAKEYDSLMKRCVAFDTELMADMVAIGGVKYSKIAALAYRQCFAAGKFVADENGQVLSFCKENHSNGCIATSDVFYPMAPQFLMYGSTVAKSFLVPFMEYAKSDRWKFPFAPHDLGTYPQANGQVYGGGEKTEENQMPVEESGNLLILMAAVAQMDGNADFAGLYWPELKKWAAYLKEKGYDPENQLCTDDFAGHLAHNVNLSVKAICGIGAYAKLCEMRGDTAQAAEYKAIALEFAKKWAASDKDANNTRLAFDQPNTWSQKYNLVWDKILGLGLFPDSVTRSEMDFYLKKQNKYGLPLDSRKDYTKLDWIVWTATLTGDRKDFEALVDPIFSFLNETPERTPMTDWFDTKTGKKIGFDARPVVGGVFIPVMYDKKMWSKYASRDVTKSKGWASMPSYTAPVVTPYMHTVADLEWAYTYDKPAADWFSTGFNASSWKNGLGPFGTTPGHHSQWKSSDIWIRRDFTLPSEVPANIGITAKHDEEVKIYINGVLAASAVGFNDYYEILELTKEGKAAFKPGKNTVAAHCRQTIGGQHIDIGIVNVDAAAKK